jgi:hypothetical protein
MGNRIYIKAQTLAADAGMQFYPRYSHWVAARGQFEGQQWWAPYYWDCVMEGDGETLCGDQEECTTAELFTVDADESEAFGIDCGATVMVRQDSQGFVLCTVHASHDEAEKIYRSWIGE